MTATPLPSPPPLLSGRQSRAGAAAGRDNDCLTLRLPLGILSISPSTRLTRVHREEKWRRRDEKWRRTGEE
jgi:hypothetical protein